MEKPSYFIFNFHKGKYVIGFNDGNWFWFYKYFLEDIDSIKQLKDIDLSNSKLLFLNYNTIENLTELVFLDDDQISQHPKRDKEFKEVWFDENEFLFKTKKQDIVKKSTIEESLLYCDIIVFQNRPIEEIKLRIIEMYYGFIPSCQYHIERTYIRFFEPYKKSIQNPDQAFTTKVRKEEFDAAFKEKIVPFAEKYGFKRHTKTSKRLFRKFENGLSVAILFEFKTFAYGSYEISIHYSDIDTTTCTDKNLVFYESMFATLKPNFPYHSNLMIDSQNKQMLHYQLAYWMRVMELYVFPFIEQNSTHSGILNRVKNQEKVNKIREMHKLDKYAVKPSYYFDFGLPKTNKEKIIKIIKEKRKNNS